MDPFAIVTFRVVITCILFWLLHALFIREKIQRQDHVRLFFCGLTGVACNQLLFFKGLSLTSQIHSSLIMITTPIIVLIMGGLFLKEKITIAQIAGICLGFAGVFILIHSGHLINDDSSVAGDICIMLNAASYGIFLVLAKPVMVKYSPFTVSKWVFLYGCLFTIPFGISSLVQTDFSSLSSDAWWSLGYVVMGATFFAYLLNILGLNYGSPLLVSIYIYSQPVIASIIAATLYHEELTTMKIISALFVFTGVALVTIPTGRKMQKAETEA